MKVLVVGGGVIGAATAFFLADAGHAVTVVERNAGPGLGASFANGGLLTPSMADPWNAPGTLRNISRWIGREDAPMLLRLRALPRLVGWGIRFLQNSSPARFERNLQSNFRLAKYSLATLRKIGDRIPLNYDHASVGTLQIFRTRDSFETALRRCEGLQSLGLLAETASNRRLVELEPALHSIGPQLTGGIHFPDDRSGDARMFTESLVRHARQLGARFLFNTGVIGVSMDRHRIVAMASASERFVADAYVIAAGASSTALLQPLGINVPLAPVKGYSITIAQSARHLPPRMPVIDHDLHAAVTPLGENLRIAGTAEFDGFRGHIDPARVQALVRMFQRLYPEHPIPEIRRELNEWAGFRPMSADGVPIIGRTPIDNLYLNTGHGHLGFTLAMGSSRALADLILQRQPDVCLDPYALHRFDRPW